MLRTSKGAEKLQPFEVALAVVTSRCEYAYGFSGRVGFLYQSAKDQLKWNGLSVKAYLSLVMQIGTVMSLSDEDYHKEKGKVVAMSTADIDAVFIAAFGKGDKS